jgi:gas vesicle protein
MKAAFGYLATGIGIGAVISILFAPRSGEQTREWLARKCFDAVDASNERVWQSRIQIRDKMNQGQRRISQAVAARRMSLGRRQAAESPVAVP